MENRLRIRARAKVRDRITTVLRRFANRDRLSYCLVVAFGISLLMITLQFQFGHTTITTPEVIVELNHGYITEANQAVRIVEGIIAVGMIALGLERIITQVRKRKRRVSNGNDSHWAR